MDRVIEAKIESFSYGEECILKNIDIGIERNEIIILAGPSGSGKSTLLRLLNGLIPTFYEGKLVGKVKILGKNIEEYKKGETAKYIGNVFQNPKDQFFCDVVEDEIALIGENLGLEPKILHKKVDEAMDLLEIGKLRKKSVFELSGGERQKAAIAGTLIFDTDIIFFDEPSSGLDYGSVEKFKEILLKLKSMGKTVVIAEHRLYYLKDIFTRLIYIKNKSIEKIFNAKELNNAKCKELGLRVLDEEELIPEKKMISGEKYIEVKGVNIYQGKRILIKDLSFELCKGEIMGVLGANGIGKTTLAKALCGLRAGDLDVSYGRRKRDRIKNSYFVLQDVDAQIFLDTVENELIFSGKDRSEPYLEEIREYLKETNLWEARMSHPQKLSAGQKQRLVIITALLSHRKLNILDEPTSGLDYKSMEIISKLISKKSEKNSFIIITHDLELLFKTCHSVLMIDEKGYRKIMLKNNEKYIRSFIAGERSE